MTYKGGTRMLTEWFKLRESPGDTGWDLSSLK